MTNCDFKVYPENAYIDLNLFQLGHERCNSTHLFGPAVRNHYLFHYVMSGKGTLFADNTKGESIIYNIEAGSGFMIFPNQVTTYFADHNDPWEYIWVEFDGILAKEYLSGAGISLDNPVYKFPLKEMRDKTLGEMIYLVENRESNPLHLIGHLYLFFDYLTRKPKQKSEAHKSGKTQYYIKTAVNFMENNFQKNITVDDVTTHCGLTRSYFGKIFKDEFDKSPQTFLIRLRMTKATELLLKTDLSIGEISASVGYPDQLHFSKSFKNIFGCSPKQWRTEHRGKE